MVSYVWELGKRPFTLSRLPNDILCLSANGHNPALDSMPWTANFSMDVVFFFARSARFVFIIAVSIGAN